MTGITWLIVTLTMIGRLCISASWQVLYVWCVELFPTTVRVIMVQTTMFAGKIGNTIGPLIRDLVRRFDVHHMIANIPCQNAFNPVIHKSMIVRVRTTTKQLSLASINHKRVSWIG